MREWGYVFSNEWMKMIHRPRFWVILILAVVLGAAISITLYMWEKEFAVRNTIGGMEKRISNAEQYLHKLKKESENGSPSSMTKERIEIQEKSVRNLKKKLERMRRLKSDDWNKVVKEDLAKLTAKMEKQSTDRSEAMDPFQKKQWQTNIASKRELQYHLRQDIPPLLPGESSSWDQIYKIMPHATGLFLPVLIIWLIADIVSGESTRGTIKLLLVRPVSRVKILLGKWATSLTVTALLTFCFFFIPPGDQPVAVRH